MGTQMFNTAQMRDTALKTNAAWTQNTAGAVWKAAQEKVSQQMRSTLLLAYDAHIRDITDDAAHTTIRTTLNMAIYGRPWP
jgi:hypothetical protein